VLKKLCYFAQNFIMKTEKNGIYFNKVYFLLLKVGIWAIFCSIFVNFSFLIPKCPNSIFQEFIVFFFLAFVINIHTSYLFLKYSKRNGYVYILLLIGSILICSLFELFIFSETFDPSYYYVFNREKILIGTFLNIAIRNLFIFIFFLWVEYFYHLIHLLKEKDTVYQKEISLLIEKQEFEKNFLRKKLLPHYFFNILELVRANSSINENELLDKIEFILYYFLVDAELETATLEKELVFYKYYIELENLRRKEKVNVNFNISGHIENFSIIPLLFEPIIGNAMKHTKWDGTGWVDIKIDASLFPVLVFYCRNNISSRTLKTNSSESGLKILKQRLELCYKDNYTYHTSQNDDYYEVTLTLKLQ